jgi:hypothetical protein
MALHVSRRVTLALGMQWRRAIEWVSDAPRIAFAWAISFVKSDWPIESYPLRFRHFDHSGYTGPDRLRPVDWSVRVLRWTGMQGHGESRDAATANLRKNFSRYRLAGEPLPRPGSYKAIEFAKSEKLEGYPEIEEDFVRHILDVEWAFLSDESSLWDFSSDDDLKELYERIRKRYGIDVSDIEGANLVATFDRIRRSSKRI